MQTLSIRALHLATRIVSPGGPQRRPAALRPVLTRLGEGRWTVVFSYGVVVTVGLTPAEEEGVLEGLAERLEHPVAAPEIEEAALVVVGGADTVDETGIRISDLTDGRILVVAEVLARSVVLAHLEIQVNYAFDRVEPLAERLSRGRRPGGREKDLLVQLGEALLTRTRTVGRVEVVEKPEILWDRPDLERLFDRLAAEYDLAERDRALNRKLSLVSDVTHTLFDMIQERQVLRVEWYIVILIVFEIVLTLGSMAGLWSLGGG